MINPDEKAFPSDKYDLGNHYQGHFGGLTKRELFAALAMAGLCANPDWSSEQIADYATEQADALINALNA